MELYSQISIDLIICTYTLPLPNILHKQVVVYQRFYPLHMLS